jgi:replication-associated recombination protein RarA
VTPTKHLPLSELLRPKTLADMALPRKLQQRLQAMVDQNNLMNMIFYGSPGTGKTTAARILAGGKSLSVMVINGTEESGVDLVRNRIASFARTKSLDLAPCKLCVIDEADQLSESAQEVLRGLIESSYSNCRFIFTANDITKIHRALQSRLLAISFDVGSTDQDEVLGEYIGCLVHHLRQQELSFDEAKIRHLVSLRFPDFRAIANRVEFEFGENVHE